MRRPLPVVLLLAASLWAAPLVAQPGRTMAVTIDNDQWIFAFLYADALRAGDSELAARLAAAYVEYMEEVFAFIEGVSRRLLDRAAARGYRFVPLDEALRDPAYALLDAYVGPWCISWLHHQEITQGTKRSPSPDPPAWVLEAYEKAGGQVALAALA